MDCERFERTIELLTKGTAGRAAKTAAEAHLACCPRCRRLYGAEVQIPTVPSHLQDMSGSILAATSGPACPAAEQVLCDAFDGKVQGMRVKLLQRHTSTCLACRDLADTMQILRQVLPEMALLDPGEQFTAGVLAATRGMRMSRRRRWSSPAQLWDKLVRRPLFAWEAAYAGTLLFALVFLNPLLPVRTYSFRALSEVRETAASAVEPAQTAARHLARNVAASVADRRVAAGMALESWTDRAQGLLNGTVVNVRKRLRAVK